MKELSHKLLPIQIEAELSKDWDLLSKEYLDLITHFSLMLRYSTTFPVERHIRFTSTKTGIEWNVMIIVVNEKMFYEACYTFYTNEYGERGIYMIDKYRCSRVTPHFIKRFKSRYLIPHRLPAESEHDIILALYTSLLPDTILTNFKGTDYLVHKVGLSIVEQAGNGTISYITFVNREMLREYQEPFDRRRDLMYQIKDNPKAKKAYQQLEAELKEAGLRFPEEYASIKARRKAPEESVQTTIALNEMRKVKVADTKFQPKVGSTRPSQQSWISEADLKKLLKK